MIKIEQHRFCVLDSWRGLAACCIALFHFRNIVNSHIHYIPFFNYSYLFVDFFFVLSGFVIFCNYEQKLRDGYSFRKFMLLRFGRLYPLHFFLLLVILSFFVVQHLFPGLGPYIRKNPFQDANELAYLPSHLFLLHGLGFDDRLSFNRPSWTISAEFYSYIVFAALIVFVRRRLAWALALVTLGAGIVLGFNDPYLIGTYDFGFVRCLYSFSIGALAWKFFNLHEGQLKTWISGKKLWNAIEIFFSIALVLLILYASNPVRMAYPFFFAAMIVAYAFEGGVISRYLSKTPFLFLGALSYSIYMLQAFSVFAVIFITGWMMKMWPEQHALIRDQVVWGATPWAGDWLIVPYLFMVVAASVFTYYLVELPGRDFFRKLVGREHRKSE